ncbi:MAG TPA: VIT domain-containing protein [Planctomycetota bacterium]|nr:VIT domain-containing protein [Planctomycetota bacterium]
MHRGTSIIPAVLLLSALSLRAEALLMPIVDGKVVHIPPVVKPTPDRPFIRPPVPNALPFRVTSSRVDVRIDENVATTTMEQSFLNQTGRDLEVRVLIPLPAGSAINNSALSMDSQMVEGKLYDARQAQMIYESIVNQRRDPALLRFAGENLYEARVFPIPPNQERRLRFSYTQMLAPSGGLYDYKHILSGSQLYQNGIEKFDFTCTVRSKQRLGPIYSPSHQVSVQRPDSNTATIRLSGANLSSESDFRLYYAPSTEDVAVRVLAHRDRESDDGYFMLIGRVDEQLEKSRVLPKEIVFVFDTSGSMQGEKIEQSKKALKFCLQSLNASDRFNLITFSTDVMALSSDKLLEANKTNIARALAAVDQIEATGGTNIDGALRAALGSDFTPGSDKAKMIAFMTDGLPTVGITDPNSIINEVSTGNAKHKVRLFNFGVGNDVNTHLLDKMALQQDGVSTYVSPREDVEIKVSDFYNKIRHPVMTDVTIDFGSGSGVNSIYPKKIPALYRGGEITILGRYKGVGPGEIVLTDNVAGETRRLTFKVEWPGRDLSSAHLPRVWAMRKIGHLIEDVRLHGENQEMIREIVQLSQRHGIVTPYTSQLVLEPGMENNFRPGNPIALDRTRGLEKGGGVPPPAPRAALAANEEFRKKAEVAAKSVSQTAQRENVGATANALARLENELKEAQTAATPARDGAAPADKDERRRQAGEALRAAFGGAAGRSAAKPEEMADALERAEAETIKQVGARTFYNRAGVWVDSIAKSDAKPIVVKNFSKEYFDLLKKDTTLGPVLALGGTILVIVDEKLYQIEE